MSSLLQLHYGIVFNVVSTERGTGFPWKRVIYCLSKALPATCTYSITCWCRRRLLDAIPPHSMSHSHVHSNKDRRFCFAFSQGAAQKDRQETLNTHSSDTAHNAFPKGVTWFEDTNLCHGVKEGRRQPWHKFVFKPCDSCVWAVWCVNVSNQIKPMWMVQII